MSISINSNSIANNIQRYISMSHKNIASSAESLASGKKGIQDGVTEYLFAKKLAMQSDNISVTVKSIEITQAMLNTIGSSLEGAQDVAQRMGQLAAQAASGNNSDSDLKVLGEEIKQLAEEWDRIAKKCRI